MPPVEFEPTISGGERPQTYALDQATTGTGIADLNRTINSSRVTKAGKVIGELRALHTEDRRNLHSMPNITRAIIEENEMPGSTKAYKVVGKREKSLKYLHFCRFKRRILSVGFVVG
jgi:hypothetical protein